MRVFWLTIWIFSTLLRGESYGAVTTNCFFNLGCLETNSSWFSQNRPFNPTPNSRENINTTFQMYTVYTRRDGEAVYTDFENFYSRNFIPKANRNYFLLHGFLSNGKIEWILEIKDELLKIFRDDCNIFVVDWSGHTVNYAQTAVNTRVVALEMIKFINYKLIKQYNVSASTIHIIGHSLGAHIGGYVGEKIKGLYRITGLDPAGQHFAGMPHYVRLDPSDASFVDVIHSDIKGYGTSQSMGHVDFYANGDGDQPGCGAFDMLPQFINQGVNPTLQETGTCGHSRAHQYFIDTLKSYSAEPGEACKIIAYKCRNIQKFDEFEEKCVSKCNPLTDEGCMFLGLQARPINKQRNVVMHFKTAAFRPFCMTDYKISIHVDAISAPVMYTTLSVTLYDSRGIATIFPLYSGNPITVQPKTVISDKVFSQSILRSKEVNMASFKWSSRFYPLSLIRKALVNGYIKIKKIVFFTMDGKNINLCPRIKNEAIKVFENEDMAFDTFSCPVEPFDFPIDPRKSNNENMNSSTKTTTTQNIIEETTVKKLKE